MVSLNGISIAELIFYVPGLLVAVFLTLRLGFRRSFGWIFLIVFTLVRIIGACLELAAKNDPDSISLQTGYTILLTIGLSPLLLTGLGLLGRCIASINLHMETGVKEYHLRALEATLTLGLILGIVGGVKASKDYDENAGMIV